MNKTFPPDFLWGAGTSAHQVEGNNFNNWTLWESQNAKSLSGAGYAPLIRVWSNVKSRLKDRWKNLEPQTKSPQNYISGKACDHYNCYAKDFDFLSQMNLNCYRFSIEWSRIEPQEGKFDQDAIEHYRQMLFDLKKRGITPMLTLWHWTNPLWFDEIGGWTNPQSPQKFNHFVQKVAKEFYGLVKYWIILNEPNVYAIPAYFFGTKPAPKKGYFAYRKAIQNLVQTHFLAYKSLKHISQDYMVGISEHIVHLEAFSNSPLNHLATKALDLWNKSFLRKIQHSTDFIGINYYHHFDVLLSYNLLHFKKNHISDTGWNIHPKGLYEVIKSISSFKKPMIITENGIADHTDTIRQKYIPEIIHNLYQAIYDGFDVRGYIHWSLLDNFEWTEGFWPRFGLVDIDYSDLSRTLRPSGKIYADIISSKNRLS